MFGAAWRCGALHRNIHRCEHWVEGETEEIDGNPDPKLQSLFEQKFDRFVALSQELVEQRAVPVQA